MLIGIAGWLVIGLLIGFTVSKLFDLLGDDPRFGIGAAVGGAVLAGALYSIISGAGVSAWNVWSLLFAAVGGAAGLVAWHVVRSRYVSRTPFTRRSSY